MTVHAIKAEGVVADLRALARKVEGGEAGRVQFAVTVLVAGDGQVQVHPHGEGDTLQIVGLLECAKVGVLVE